MILPYGQTYDKKTGRIRCEAIEGVNYDGTMLGLLLHVASLRDKYGFDCRINPLPDEYEVEWEIVYYRDETKEEAFYRQNKARIQAVKNRERKVKMAGKKKLEAQKRIDDMRKAAGKLGFKLERIEEDKK